jgi:hypothetical protein
VVWKKRAKCGWRLLQFAVISWLGAGALSFNLNSVMMSSHAKSRSSRNKSEKTELPTPSASSFCEQPAQLPHGMTKYDFLRELKRTEGLLIYEKQRRKEAQLEAEKQRQRIVRSLDVRVLRGTCDRVDICNV